MNVAESVEIVVLGPADAIDLYRRSVHDAVGEGKLVVDPGLGGGEGAGRVEVDDAGLLCCYAD